MGIECDEYENENEVLFIRALTKTYGKGANATKALDGIDLDVKTGEFVAIMGASGSGKTTLLNIIATFDQKTSGTLLIDGADVSRLGHKELSAFRREKLGFIFQDFSLLNTMTGFENIALPLSISGIAPKTIKERVVDIACRLGVREIMDKYPYEMSGGEKQRIASARALVRNPKLVLADEPTGALDSKSARALLESITGLNKDMKATILMVTHDPFAASFAQRILFIRDGKVIDTLRKNGNDRQRFFDGIMAVISSWGEGK